VLVVTVLVWAVLAPLVWRDLQRRDAEDVRGPKWLWRLASTNLTGIVAYALIGRRGPRRDLAGPT
jgi:hypothetical protein